jgi:hypothetical protein
MNGTCRRKRVHSEMNSCHMCQISQQLPIKHLSSSVFFALFFCEAPGADHPEKNWAKFEYIKNLARWT